MAPPLLVVNNLSRPGIEPVSFAVTKGECVVISGSSGAGKTLLLRAVADLDPSDGDVCLEGVSRQHIPAPSWRRQVSYVAAEPGWWADSLAAHFQSPDEIRKKASDLGLDPGLIDQPVARLSTGERQRFALLRVLEHTPKVLLLDEPTGTLDAENAGRVAVLLESLINTGLSAVIVTHDETLKTRLGGRRFCMNRGRLSAI